MDSQISDSPGESLDSKYRILRRLAVGGMAEIYLAESTQMHGFKKKVVIKRILPQYAEDPVYVDMFLDEARLVAQLNHPSIIQVFDIGEESEGVFFTMEYVEGRDLADILGTAYKQRKQLSLEEVLAIAVPAAEALHHAHELRDEHGDFVNLVHRDVSPSNVIVTNEGRVKLLDFGVAKSKGQLRATTGISLKGKFGYMAPEQCQGLELDRRSDIFSYGVLLWELFAGKRLFPGGNEPSVLMKIMDGNFPLPTSVRPELPKRLDDICLRALAVNRDDRYPTLQALLTDLDEFRRENGTVTTSRTLSNMLTSLFGAPKVEPKPAAQRRTLPLQARPETNSEITRAPSGIGDMGESQAMDENQTLASSTPGRWTPRPGVPLPGSTSSQVGTARPQISAGISAPTVEEEDFSLSNPGRKRGVLIALGFLGVAGVASLALGLGSSPDSKVDAQSPSSPGELETDTAIGSKAAVIPDTAIIPDTSVKSDIAANPDTAINSDPAINPDPAVTAVNPDTVVNTDTALNTDTAVNPEKKSVAAEKPDKLDNTVTKVATDPGRSEKATDKRQRNKNRRKKNITNNTNPDKPIKKPIKKPKWDPNSPFAPE